MGGRCTALPERRKAGALRSVLPRAEAFDGVERLPVEADESAGAQMDICLLHAGAFFRVERFVWPETDQSARLGGIGMGRAFACDKQQDNGQSQAAALHFSPRPARLSTKPAAR